MDARQHLPEHRPRRARLVVALVPVDEIPQPAIRASEDELPAAELGVVAQDPRGRLIHGVKASREASARPNAATVRATSSSLFAS